MDNENNGSGSNALPRARLVPSAEAARRRGPAWEGHHRSGAADRALSGCLSRMLGASINPAEMPASTPDDVLLVLIEGDRRKMLQVAPGETIEKTSNACGPSVGKLDETKASDCIAAEESRSRFLLDGGDVSARTRSLHTVSGNDSPPSPANQYSFDTTAGFDKPTRDRVALPELSKESIAGVAVTTATGQHKQYEARRATINTRTSRVSESSIDSLVSSIDTQAPVAEWNQEHNHHSRDGFEGLLAEATQQSDADRARDREDASNFASLQEQQQSHLDDRTPGSTQSARGSTADRQTSDAHEEQGQSDSKHNANEATNAAIDSRPPSNLPASTSEPKAVRCQWVKYVSPEGYPYLFDEVTGDSKWVVTGEEKEGERNQTPEVQEPMSGGASREPESKEGTLRSRDGQMEAHDIADAKLDEKSTMKYGTENSSVGTCDASSLSQEASGPDARNYAGETAMHLAAAQHSPRGLLLLLGSGANINAANHRGQTPLHAVCVSPHGSCSERENDPALLECMHLLLSSGALEDARDVEGQTPLHLAAHAGNLSAAKALLAAGATVTADDAGNSPLHVAAAQGHSDIIQLLVAEDRHESMWQPRVSSDEYSRGQGRTPADVGRLSPATDCVFMAAEQEIRKGPAERQKYMFPGNDGDAFGAIARTKQQQEKSKEGASCSRQSYLRHIGRRILSAAGETPLPKVDRRDLGERSYLKSTPGSLDGHLHQAVAHHELVATERQRNVGTRRWLFENPTEEARKTSNEDKSSGHGWDRLALEHEHRRRLEGKEARRHSKRSRRRHGNGRGDRMLRWPEALAEREYQQIMEAAFTEEEDSSGIPSRSTVSAALFAACVGSRSDDTAAVLGLLDLLGGRIAEVWDDNGRTPLHHVCHADDVGLLHILCRAGSDLEARDYQGNSPLAVAAAEGSFACLQVLIQQGCYLSGFNDVGDAPLHLAVRHGNLACVKALVEAGARLNQRNQRALTPREDLLDAAPMFTRSGLPKASTARPTSPTWTAQDDYKSEATAAISNLQYSSPRHRQQLGTGGQYDRMGLASKPHTNASPGSANAGRREHQQVEKQRDFQGGKGTLEDRSEVCSDGSEQGNLSRRDSNVGYGVHQVPQQDTIQRERRSCSSWEGEMRGGRAEEIPPALASAPSRLREGVWSVFGRAIDSLIGGGNAGHSNGSQPAPDGSDGSNDGDLGAYGNGRPPTDAEQRARGGSEDGTIRANCSGLAGVTSQLHLPSSTEQVHVPISLTPMKPPPDVLAVMKGRVAGGQRRPRFASPPADVAEALKNNMETKRYHQRGSYEGVWREELHACGSNPGALGCSAISTSS